jgi:phosphodiesterase/alkaline phosphatase D-like protein
MRKIVLVSLVASLVAAASAWAASTPAVVTGSATAISNSGAVLHATVDPEGSATSYTFQYGPTTAYGATSSTGEAGHGTGARAVTRKLAGLTPGTLYHYRIDAGNHLGSTVGRDRTFQTTGHPPPGAITGVASGVGKNTVTLTGTVVSQSETTSAYFEYGTTTAYGLQTPAQTVTASATPTAVAYALTGLAPGTTFHYRLVAAHAGVAPEYGLDAAFTTIPLVRFRARMTTSTVPGRVRHKPYQFTTSGTVVPAVPLAPGYGCSGLVTVRFSLGKKAVAFRKVALQPTCAYATSVAFRHLVHHTKTRLRVTVRFHGNSYLRPRAARTKEVRLG